MYISIIFICIYITESHFRYGCGHILIKLSGNKNNKYFLNFLEKFIAGEIMSIDYKVDNYLKRGPNFSPVVKLVTLYKTQGSHAPKSEVAKEGDRKQRQWQSPKPCETWHSVLPREENKGFPVLSCCCSSSSQLKFTTTRTPQLGV